MTLQYKEFCRKPFVVEAVEVTRENIGEIAKFVGKLETLEDGNQFILVDPSLVQNVIRVFPGYYMTRMGEQIRCYSKRVFREQFALLNETTQEWVDIINKGAA